MSSKSPRPRTRAWTMTLATVGFAVSMLISGVSTSALAGNAFSSYGYYTVGSTTYENQAEIATWTGPNATAWTQTQKSGGGTPNGWAGHRQVNCDSAVEIRREANDVIFHK